LRVALRDAVLRDELLFAVAPRLLVERPDVDRELDVRRLVERLPVEREALELRLVEREAREPPLLVPDVAFASCFCACSNSR
jgi:hypothetical protein